MRAFLVSRTEQVQFGVQISRVNIQMKQAEPRSVRFEVFSVTMGRASSLLYSLHVYFTWNISYGGVGTIVGDKALGNSY